MQYDRIRYELDGGIATITLDRPDKLNAYTPEMGEQIVDAFARAGGDDSARIVILTGSGRAFCAGVDLDYVKGLASGAIRAKGARLGSEAFVTQWPVDVLNFPKPVIAAVNGAAVGVGITMILPCDIRIAARGAVLKLNFAKLGMLPGLGSTHLLPALVGTGKALDLILGAGALSAEEATAIGLVQEVVAGDELLATARKRALAIAESRPEVIAAAKRLLPAGDASATADAIRRERESSAALRRQ